MNYVRVDEAQVTSLNIFYFIYPLYKGEEEPDYDDTLLFSQPFDSYDEATNFAMEALKSPELLSIKWNSTHPDFLQVDDAYLKKLKTLSEVGIFQELLVYNDKWELVDCPVDYTRYVGKVFKDDEEEEQVDPEKIYS